MYTSQMLYCHIALVPVSEDEICSAARRDCSQFVKNAYVVQVDGDQGLPQEAAASAIEMQDASQHPGSAGQRGTMSGAPVINSPTQQETPGVLKAARISTVALLGARQQCVWRASWY